MRKICLAVLAVCLSGILLCGCGKAPKPAAETKDATSLKASGTAISGVGESGALKLEKLGSQVEPASNPESVTLTEAEQGGPYGRISLSLPEGWEFEACPVDSDSLISGMYGIHFYPENEPEGFIELAYIDFFGVCGTGLESESVEVVGNPARIGTYDNHEYWDFISFQGEYEGMVALSYSVENWKPEHFSQIMDILNTLSFQPSEKEGGAYIYCKESEIDALGLSFSLKNISSKGATIVFDQYDPDAPTGELEFGSDFVLEALDNGKWEAVPVALEEKYGFDAVAYMIAAGEHAERELDWGWLYGELSAGEYRVGKVVHDFRETGDFDKYAVYAQFILY